MMADLKFRTASGERMIVTTDGNLNILDVDSNPFTYFGNGKISTIAVLLDFGDNK